MIQRLEIYRKFWAAMILILLLVTTPLWLGSTNFPQVPLISALVKHDTFPEWLPVDVFLLRLICLGLATQWLDSLLQFCGSRRTSLVSTAGLLMVVIGFLLEFLINQHRIQAWAYHAVIVATLLIPMTSHGANDQAGIEETRDANRQHRIAISKRVIARLRWIVIGVYFFSGISKLDYTFLETLGPQMFDGLLGVVGLRASELPDWVVSTCVWGLPISELLISIGLIFQRTRRWACIAAVGMHVALLALVGPLGWQHQWGVAVWNAMFAVQAVLLFGLVGTKEESGEVRAGGKVNNEKSGGEHLKGTVSFSEQVSSGVLTVVMFLPTLSWVNVADHWPSWELYAPRTSRATIWVAANRVNDLPAEAKPFLFPEENNGWQRLDVAAWSLQACNAPIYPEDRFFIGVALGLESWLKDDRAIRVQWRSTADRWNGVREEKTLVGFQQIHQFAATFRLNAEPILLEHHSSDSSNLDSGR